MVEVHSFVCDEGCIRLDRYASRKYPELSRTYIQKLIDGEYIRVNEHAAKPALKLNAGDIVTVSIPPTPPSSLLPEDIPLTILYEDEDLLAIDKPPGLTVHPAPGHPNHTLVNAILAHFPHLTDIGDSVRPGIVHRLDKDTSGVMLVAKTKSAQTRLMEQFRTHSVLKVYLVLVKGHLTPDSGIIEAPIGRDPGNRQRMAVVSRGREAHTEYQVTDTSESGRWLSVEGHVKLNTPGQSNGIFTLYLDGQVAVHRDDLNWVYSWDDYGINAVFLENYWNSGSPVEQERYFDDFVISQSYIGLAKSPRNPTVNKTVFHDDDPGAMQSAWQLQVAHDLGGTDVVWDSETIAGAGLSVIIDEANGTFAGSLLGEYELEADHLYALRVRQRRSDDRPSGRICLWQKIPVNGSYE